MFINRRSVGPPPDGRTLSRQLERRISGGPISACIWALAALAAVTFAVPAYAACVSSATTCAKATTAHVIVHFSRDLTQADRSALAALGCSIYRNLTLIHSAAMTLPERNLAKVSSLSFVAHVSPDAGVAKSDAFTVNSSLASVAYQQYGLTGAGVTVAVVDSGIFGSPDLITASNTYFPANPQPANVQLPKTSTNPHPQSLDGRLLAAVNFSSDSQSTDDCGHGTHVAGIIGGDGYWSPPQFCSQTFYGVARNVGLVSVKVLDNQGQGTVSGVVAGLQWVVANASQFNIRVVNLSLGQPITEPYSVDPLCQACEAVWKSGIVVVCAAGNGGRLNSTQTAGAANNGWGTNYGSIQSPGNDPYVITVGASDKVDANRADDTIATYSSRGPSAFDFVAKPDIIAPGNQVTSTLAPNSYLLQEFGLTNGVSYQSYVSHMFLPTLGPLLNQNSPSYFVLSGTSMAAPVVSGAAALLLQMYPGLSPDTVKARLMMSADPMTQPGGVGDICTYGAGYLDIPSALKSTVTAKFSAQSPELYQDASGNVHILANGNLWGNAATCTNGVWTVESGATIWGTPITSPVQVYGSHALWGNSALWGDGELSANSALWGDHALWGDNALWGDSPAKAKSSMTTAVDLSDTALNGE